MIRLFRATEAGLQRETWTVGAPVPEDAIWIDAVAPDRAERQALEADLGLPLPTREAMVEIEQSSRVYRRDGALIMTIPVLWKVMEEAAETTPVALVRAGDRLVTLRFAEPQALMTFIQKMDASTTVRDADGMMLAIFDALIDRLADNLEHVGGRMSAISREVFRATAPGPSNPMAPDLEGILRQIGRLMDITGLAAESLVVISRVLSSAGVDLKRGEHKQMHKSLQRDARQLSDHANSLSGKGTFLLDATLGLINIEQTNVMKIFSVIAAFFLPPTLVAGIYGMNFRVMPELGWDLGYPFAVLLMLASALVPYWIFRRKGWL